MSRIPPAFGPFEPLRRLGAGGMAETFVALRRGPGRFEQTVCIKRILPAYEGDAEFVAAFLDEARTSAGLRHANIVQVLDFGVADGAHYLALELIDGVDLRALLHPETGVHQIALPAELVTLIALDLAHALAHAHGPDPLQPRVAHRDISPSNVLVSKAGEIKLTDFGIARAAHHTRRTRTGVLKGKVPYMPPEYVEHGLFDARSDLFSLGVLLYELLTAARPFDGATDLETVRRITTGQRRSLLSDASPSERALRECIEQLLATDPRARFQSAAAFADALPEVSTHHGRSRLANLVVGPSQTRADPALHRPKARADNVPWSELPTAHAPTRPVSSSEAATVVASVAPAERRGTERLLPAHPVAARGSERTRTIAGRRRSPWLFTGLGAAAIGASALLWAGARAAELREQRFASVPALPTPPAVPVAKAASLSPLDETRPTALPPTEAAGPAIADPERGASTTAPEAADVSAARASAVTSDVTRLRIVVVPYGDVWVDGERVGTAPMTVRVSRGSHVVAVGAGQIDASLEVHAKAPQQHVTFRRNPDGTFRHN